MKKITQTINIPLKLEVEYEPKNDSFNISLESILIKNCISAIEMGRAMVEYEDNPRLAWEEYEYACGMMEETAGRRIIKK